MNTEAMGLENENFSHEVQCQCMCTWEFFAYIFFGIRKTLTQKISTNQTLFWWIPSGKFSPEIFPPMLLNIPARVFLISLLLPLSLISLKRLSCNSMFQKWNWSLFVCENLPKQSLKWRKAINEMGGNNPGENFLGTNFLGVGVFQGGVWWVGILREGISPGEGILIEPFSSYNVSILIFQKIVNKYYKTFNKKICTFNS